MSRSGFFRAYSLLLWGCADFGTVQLEPLVQSFAKHGLVPPRTFAYPGGDGGMGEAAAQLERVLRARFSVVRRYRVGLRSLAIEQRKLWQQMSGVQDLWWHAGRQGSLHQHRRRRALSRVRYRGLAGH